MVYIYIYIYIYINIFGTLTFDVAVVAHSDIFAFVEDLIRVNGIFVYMYIVI